MNRIPRLATDAEVEELRQRIASSEQTLAELREQTPEMFSDERIAERLERARRAAVRETGVARFAQHPLAFLWESMKHRLHVRRVL